MNTQVLKLVSDNIENPKIIMRLFKTQLTNNKSLREECLLRNEIIHLHENDQINEDKTFRIKYLGIKKKYIKQRQEIKDLKKIIQVYKGDNTFSIEEMQEEIERLRIENDHYHECLNKEEIENNELREELERYKRM